MLLGFMCIQKPLFKYAVYIVMCLLCVKILRFFIRINFLIWSSNFQNWRLFRVKIEFHKSSHLCFSLRFIGRFCLLDLLVQDSSFCSEWLISSQGKYLLWCDLISKLENAFSGSLLDTRSIVAHVISSQKSCWTRAQPPAWVRMQKS